jgi:hypothetical protein
LAQRGRNQRERVRWLVEYVEMGRTSEAWKLAGHPGGGFSAWGYRRGDTRRSIPVQTHERRAEGLLDPREITEQQDPRDRPAGERARARHSDSGPRAHFG